MNGDRAVTGSRAPALDRRADVFGMWAKSTAGNGSSERITLASVSTTGLERRVVAAAEEALARQKFVTVADVCIGIGWLHGRHVDSWRQGNVPELESFLPVHDDRLAQIPAYLQRWAEAKALKPVETDYVAASRDRRPLRFTSAGDPFAERAWRTHWISAELSAPQRERMAAPPDLVVVQPVKDWSCAECGGTGDLLIMDNKGPICLTCADLDHLVFPGCPAGRAEAIALHTSLRGSGRVGRSAAGRSLDEKAITLAVVASVRHQDTDYDSLLMSGVPRDVAREQIKPAMEQVLGAWA